MSRKPAGTQKMQQDNRNARGRYKDGPLCEMCGRHTGWNYCSDHRVDGVLHGFGLVLCDNCADRLIKLPDAEVIRLLQEARIALRNKNDSETLK